MEANDLTKEYGNGEVTIVCGKNSLCIHAAQCVKNNPDVLQTKESRELTRNFINRKNY
jgi:uncharacterized Fe-S cluster protein YjdI